MISTKLDILLAVLMFAGAVYLLARYVRWRMQHVLFEPGGYVPDQTEGGEDPDEIYGFDLSCPVTRARLARMLHKYAIVGSADIRDGRVYEPVSFERMHPLLQLIDNANNLRYHMRNPASCSLYIRDSVNDRFHLVPDIDLDDLREIAELLRAAVADKARRANNEG